MSLRPSPLPALGTHQDLDFKQGAGALADGAWCLRDGRSAQAGCTPRCRRLTCLTLRSVIVVGSTGTAGSSRAKGFCLCHQASRDRAALRRTHSDFACRFLTIALKSLAFCRSVPPICPDSLCLDRSLCGYLSGPGGLHNGITLQSPTRHDCARSPIGVALRFSCKREEHSSCHPPPSAAARWQSLA